MPRNRYTRFVRKMELHQIARQEKELVDILRRLRYPDMESQTERPIVQEKEHRTARLDQKRWHKTKHAGGAAHTRPQQNKTALDSGVVPGPITRSTSLKVTVEQKRAPA